MTLDVPALLREAADAAREAGVRFAVIGGCARNAYAEPRATKDVDLVAEVDPSGHERLGRALAARGFRRASAVAHGPGPVPDAIFYRDDAGRRIDVLFAHTEFEREALDGAGEASPYDGVSVPVVSPEALIVYKLVAGRTQDIADVEAVARTFAAAGRSVDWAMVERWAVAWDVEPRLKAVRASLGTTSPA